jgi:hypothetical protein
MSVRRSSVEHPFGTIKFWTAPCRFLTRRLSGVRMEMALNALTHHIERMISLVGTKGLMAAIPGWMGPKAAGIADQTCISLPAPRHEPACDHIEPNSTRWSESRPHTAQVARFSHSLRWQPPHAPLCALSRGAGIP